MQHVAGSPDALREACKTIDAGVRQRRGKTAERILVKETVELPSDVEDEPAAWKASAEAIVADWRERGHEAVAAVHLHGEERDHPHLHVLVAARPVNADGGVDRSRRLLVGKAAVKAERANAAERINEACEPKIRFHPGKLKEIGIERASRRSGSRKGSSAPGGRRSAPRRRRRRRSRRRWPPRAGKNGPRSTASATPPG